MAEDKEARPRTVDPDEVGSTKFTGRGYMLGAPAPTTDMQQPTRPHDTMPNPPKGEQRIEEPPLPEPYFQPTMQTMVRDRKAS